MEARTSFLGIPVEGDYNRGEKRVPQKPLEELTALLQALVDDPGIEWFEWTQYTPYFNDGEPCVFSIHENLAVKVTPESRAAKTASYDDHGALVEDDGDWDDDDISDGVEYNKSLGKRDRKWDPRLKHYVNGEYEGPDEARYDHCLALEKALGSGAFNDDLLDLFGDHARVRVSRQKIQVETYDHD